MNQDSITPLREFQERLESLTPQDFENFVVDILRSTHRFSEIKRNAVIGGSQIDVVAIERDSLSMHMRKWFFEIKKIRVVSADVVHKLIGLKSVLQHLEPQISFVLVVAGHLTAEACHIAERFGLEVWDALKLASLTPQEMVAAYFGEPINFPNAAAYKDDKADSLIESLHSISPGREGWVRFQQLSSQLLEYLFCPPLETPRYEFSDADSRNRRDMILENSSVDGFWSQIRNIYDAHYIVADAKNYGSPLKKQPVLDLAHYLKSYGCGLFGLLLCRRGAGLSAQHALREQWIGGHKMMIVLGDAELEEMIRIRSTGGKPEELIRKLIADFRMSL